MEKGFTAPTLHRVVATLEYKSDFGTRGARRPGNIQMIIPKTSLGLYARSSPSPPGVRRSHQPPALPRRLRTRDRDDADVGRAPAQVRPDLLQVFMKVLAIPPVKVLSNAASRGAVDHRPAVKLAGSSSAASASARSIGTGPRRGSSRPSRGWGSPALAHGAPAGRDATAPPSPAHRSPPFPRRAHRPAAGAPARRDGRGSEWVRPVSSDTSRSAAR